jgi:hypothetical protein
MKKPPENPLVSHPIEIEKRGNGKKVREALWASLINVSVNSLGRGGNESLFFGIGLGNERKKNLETRG